MDPESPLSRVERTMWTVWYYITGAVNRFLRPEPADTPIYDPDGLQESAVDSLPPERSHAEDASDTGGGVVDEEQPLATAPLLSLSQPVVAWDLCTTDISLDSDEERLQHKTQFRRGSESKESEGGEGTLEEQSGQAGNDEAGLPVAKDESAEADEREKTEFGRPRGHGPDEADQHVNIGTQNAMSEDMENSEGEAEAEEETVSRLEPDVPQKMEDTVTEIQVKEEDEKMQHEGNEELEGEDNEVKLSTDLSQEDVGDMHQAAAQRDDAVTVTQEEGEDSEGVLQLNESEAEEETVSRLEPDVLQKMEDTMTEIQVKEEDDKMQHEGNEELEGEDNEVKLSTDLSQEDMGDMHQAAAQRDDAVTVTQEEGEDSEGVLQLNESAEGPTQAEKDLVSEGSSGESEDEPVVTGQEDVVIPRGESDDEEEKSSLSDREQEENVSEATDTQTTDGVQEQEEDFTAEDGKEENFVTDNVTNSEKEVLKTTDQEDVVVTEEQTSEEVRGTFVEVGEVNFSSEADMRESHMEIPCTPTSVTVIPEGETGQEISGEFKNIPQGVHEGQIVVSQELNTPTCEETQEGVPEYNNEPGPDENSTQWFLEDDEETRTTRLPEEEESKAQESLENSVWGTGADYSLERQPMEEKQEDIKKSFDLVAEEHTGLTDTAPLQEAEEPLVEAVIQESEDLFEEEGGMKTEINPFGIHVGLEDEAGKTTDELQDEAGELLVDFATDEGDSRDADEGGFEMKETSAAEEEEEEEEGEEEEEDDVVTDDNFKFLQPKGQKMTETSFFQELAHAIHTEENSNSLLDDMTESGFLKHPVETEPKLLDDSTVETEDAGICATGHGFRDEEEEAEDETQNKDEMESSHLQEAAVELITEKKENEDSLIAQSELSGTFETQEAENQFPNSALEISDEMITDTEAADESKTAESKPKDLPAVSVEAEMPTHEVATEGSDAGGTSSGHQDVIDEEILDLWIEAAMSEDTNDVEKQEEPERQMDTRTDPLNEEEGETTLEKEMEQVMESPSGEAALVSDIEMSSSTVESGFSDQSLSETQLLKSTSTGSLQDIHDIWPDVSESADMSKSSALQPQDVPASQDVLMEQTAEAAQSSLKAEESITQTGTYPDSGVTSPEVRHLNQDTQHGETDEERVESAESDTETQREGDVEVTDQAGETDWKCTGEVDVTCLTNMSTVFQVQETTVEPLQITVSESSDVIQHVKSGHSRSGSEASSEEGIMLSEAHSQGDKWSEPEKKLPSLDEPQPGWLEDTVESLSELTQETVTASEDQHEVDSHFEVDALLLDLTVQRSRIAVKNPRIRPPKDPRSLIHKPSVDPTPSSRVPVKVPAGVPLGGLGIGIKLPGLGAGFPVLKKTRQLVKDENDTVPQETEEKPEEKSDAAKQEEAPRKPKWMPPGHAGFGNPLMSELKTKLKKTTKE